MNIGRVYTPAIWVARGRDPSIGGIGAYNEYWKGVNPSNIRREGYRPFDMGYSGTRGIFKGCTLLQHSLRGV